MASNRPGGSGRRKRTKFSKSQLQVLIEAFVKDPYPDVTVREKLAKQIQIPQSRIQVWFQNRRGRQSKKSQRRSPREADAAAPGPRHQGLQGPSPPRGSGSGSGDGDGEGNGDGEGTLQRYAPGAEGASGPAVLWGHSGVLGANVVSPDRKTAAQAPGKPPGSFHHSPDSGFSPSAMGAFPAPQQPFQGAAGGIDTHLGDPRPLIYGDWALQGQGQHFPSDGQQPWGCWHPLLAPQQPLSQHPGAWKQPPPPPSAQEHWLDPAETTCLEEEEEEEEEP